MLDGHDNLRGKPDRPSLRFDVPHDCSVELSPQGYQFFTDIFQIFDKVCCVVRVWHLSVCANLSIHFRIKMERSDLKSSIIYSTPPLGILGQQKTTKVLMVLSPYNIG